MMGCMEVINRLLKRRTSISLLLLLSLSAVADDTDIFFGKGDGGAYAPQVMILMDDSVAMGNSRLKSSVKIMEDFFDANPDIEFGLATLPPYVFESPLLPRANTSGADKYIEQHKLITSHASITDRWDKFETRLTQLQNANESAQLCTAYHEIYKYIKGDERSDENLSGNGNIQSLNFTYRSEPYGGYGKDYYYSPVRQKCQNISIFIVSAGMPKNDTGYNSTIKKLTGKNCKKYGGNESCMPQLAEYMANPGKNGVDGKKATGYQEARTYTISYGKASTLLSDTAEKGKGKCFTTENPSSNTGCETVTDLREALDEALKQVLEGSNSFVSPSVSVNTSNRTDVLQYTYLAMFEASEKADWSGNLKKLRIFKKGSYQSGDPCYGKAMSTSNANGHKDGTLVDSACKNAFKDGSTQFVDDVHTFWGGNNDKDVAVGGFGSVLKSDVNSRVIYTNQMDDDGKAELIDLEDISVSSTGLLKTFSYKFEKEGSDQNLTNFRTSGTYQFSSSYTVGDEFYIYQTYEGDNKVRVVRLDTASNGSGSIKVRARGIGEVDRSKSGWDDLSNAQRLAKMKSISTATVPKHNLNAAGWGIIHPEINSSGLNYGYVTKNGNPLKLPSYSGTLTSSNIANWVRGKNKQGNTVRPWVMGDIQHSSPVTLNYGDTDGDSTKYTDDAPDLRVVFGTNHGVLHFLQDDLSTPTGTVKEKWSFFAKETIGNLSDLMDNTSPDHRIYGLDGPVSVIRIDANSDGNIIHSDGDRMLIFFGMRRGGTTYYGMDVTRPDHKPKLLWQIDSSTPGFEELGQSWSKMIPVVLPGHRSVNEDTKITSYKYALAFGAGYDGADDAGSTQGKDDLRHGKLEATNKDRRLHSTRGRGLYIIDAGTGKLISSFTANNSSLSPVSDATQINDSRFKWSVAAPPVALDSDGDGLHDRLYFADTGGNVFRVDIGRLTGDDKSESAAWSVSTLAVLGMDANTDLNLDHPDSKNDRRFFYQPAVANTKYNGKAYDAVLLGSGNRANPTYKGTHVNNDTETKDDSVQDRFFMLRDTKIAYTKYVDCSGSKTAQPGETCEPAPIKGSDLYDATANLIQQGSDKDGEISKLKTSKGWFMNFETATGSSHYGEKAFSRADIISGVASITTWEPAGSYECTPSAGTSRAYFVSLQDATAVKNYDDQNGLDKGDRVVSELSGVSGGQVFVPINDKIVAIPSSVDLDSEIGFHTYSWLQEK
ncbi:pilus assembly protein [Endozoicomonas ascidiicola]|uniref:pilus assembly protein n=1 Tax=Endozoicomonas ascidiicola TaxID=1698521 RepID=UPI000832EBF1|nr:PilC/PilY family type IV pilus protein [Endozoicomonas ascidiicola]